jgi:hypothetical protein
MLYSGRCSHACSQRGKDASACIRRHQAFAMAPVPTTRTGPLYFEGEFSVKPDYGIPADTRAIGFSAISSYSILNCKAMVFTPQFLEVEGIVPRRGMFKPHLSGPTFSLAVHARSLTAPSTAGMSASIQGRTLVQFSSQPEPGFVTETP